VGRPWPKGVSGNPGGGRKPNSDVRLLARAGTVEAVQALLEVVRQRRVLPARVSAAIAILDRAWGKPVQAVEHSGPEGERLFPPATELSDEHLERVLTVIREVRSAAHGNGHAAP
jgi:hypothetical protein